MPIPVLQKNIRANSILAFNGVAGRFFIIVIIVNDFAGNLFYFNYIN